MSFQFDGKILEGIRLSPVNASTTAEPITGVVRDIRGLPAPYQLAAPSLVAAAADQYRVAALEAPGSTIVEYLVWAQNSGQLATVEDSSWWTIEGDGNITVGTLNVTAYPGLPAEVTYTDGTDTVVVVDDGNRSIGSIICLVVARGDVEYDDDGWKDVDNPFITPQPRKGLVPYLTFIIDATHQNPVSGLVTLTDAQLTLLDGGLSIERGDRIIQPRYTVATPRFWWTRNDRYEKRFGWNAVSQRWEPWKGSGVKNLGYLLLEEASFTMEPKLQNYPVGAILPGDALTPDSYSMIRLGTDPGVTSTPAGPGNGFVGIMVEPDDTIDDFDFSTAPTLVAVMGQTNGKLVFNPVYVQLHAGKSVWYSYKSFSADEDGVIGTIQDSLTSTLFLAPLPGPTDAPLIRYGNRSYLETITFENDVALDAELQANGFPSEGQIYLSLSTGRLVLSPTDQNKADPDNPNTFSKYFLGESVIYDGVSLCQRPQPTKSPVRLVDEAGDPTQDTGEDIFLPDAEYLPSTYDPTAWNNTYRGLGTSGILNVPDGTGSTPISPAIGASVPVRPGGDNFDPGGLMDPNIGMVRELKDGVSDTIIFGRNRAITTTQSYRVFEDIPKLRGGQAAVCLQLESGTPGSQVYLSRYDRRQLDGSYIYLLQAALVPAIYTEKAKIYSRNRDIFRFDGTETLYFAVDGTDYSWPSSGLVAGFPDQASFTAAEVAANMALVFAGITAQNGRIVITGTTSVEIGFGGADKDLTGAAVLGFLPGWLAEEGVASWLPDSGVSVGLFRSPVNQDRSKATCDFAYIDRIRDGLLSESIQPNPFFFLQNVPLQDIAGFDENIFFRLVSFVFDEDNLQVVYKNLEHYKDVIYRFGQRKFDWISDGWYKEPVERTLDTLNLGHSGVVPESMMGAPGISGGLYVNSGEGGLVLQIQENDYILPFEGAPGNATLIHRYGSRVNFGAQGTFVAGQATFQDVTTNFNDPDKQVEAGYRLKITGGDAEGSYTVESVDSDTSLTVSPAFLWSSDRPATWELFEGYTKDVYDPMIVADMVYQNFQHMPEEPFKVRSLSYIGDIPTDSYLKANIEGALSSNRIINIRYGAVPPTTLNTATLTWLTKTDLGVIENGSLVLPDTTSIRYTEEAFSIQVGTVVYSHGDATHPLVKVTSFSNDPGTSIEYLNVVTDPVFPKGQLKFGSTVLATYAESRVLVKDEFLPAASLEALHAEISPWSGEVNLSEDDLQNFDGRIYFVEQMNTQTDLSVQPMSGNVAFLRPLPKGTLIEMEYYGADLEGRKLQYPVLSLSGEPTGLYESRQITEFLPVFVRDEVAVRQSNRIFTFNAAKKTIYQDITPIIYIRSAQQNYNETNCLIDYMPDGTGKLTFLTYDVTDGVDVKVTYAVAEAQGGERSYETSTKPVYRPPFYITANQNRFGLFGDRTDEFVPGQLLRFGKENFYVKGTRYYPTLTDSKGNTSGNITAVYIYPKTIEEVGSRAPAREVLSLKTLLPITPVVDPSGQVVGPDGTTNPVDTGAMAGLMHSLDITEFPFEPMNKGQTDIVFLGNVTSITVPGHIIEFGGVPYTIVGSELSDDGTRTVVSIASGIRQAFTVDDNPTVLITARPVYPPNVVDFLGVGPFVPDEGFELVQYGLTDDDGQTLPGKTLVNTVDYVFDPANGFVTFLEPLQDPLNAPESLVMSFVRLRQLSPFIQNGAIIRPTYSATYLNIDAPSTENGLLGGFLQGTYTFRSPDSFYFRIVPMTQFLVEITEEVIKEITNQQPSSGAPQPTGGTENWEFGRVGLVSERRHLTDKDRVARTFLDFYNTTTNSFEQIGESITGDLVGDRDGKFRFWVGRGKEWPTPGYEDEITGLLTPRNVWTDVFSSYVDTTPPRYVYIQPYDKVVDPEGVTIVDSLLEGSVPDVDTLHLMMDAQKDAVTNEVDDIIMASFKAGSKKKDSFPYFYFLLFGIFRKMYQNHKFSRIFPRWTKTFFRTNPGIDSDLDTGDPGWYSAGRFDFEGEYRRTTKMTIGQIANPVLGEINQVRSAYLTKRLGRARLWQYFPDGIPEGAFGLVGAISSPAIVEPCLIATPGLIKDFPINPITGYPDRSQFLSLGGEFPDLDTGDPEMAVPPFEVGEQIGWGKPNGRILEAYCGSKAEPSGSVNNALTGIYVNAIQYGCVMTFQDADGNLITDPNDVMVGISASVGIPADQTLEQGDTVQSVPVIGTVEVNNPPTTEDMALMANNLSVYRQGFDIRYSQDGQLLDITMPSEEDPAFWPLKEAFGQNPPPPVTCLEGSVEFYYSGQNPLLIPALEGEFQDDSGDYHVPFLLVRNTELDRYNDGVILADILKIDDHLPLPWGLYPNEWMGNDGCVTTLPLPATQSNIIPANEPAALLTTTDVQPKATEASEEPGTADLDEYDLLFTQVSSPSPFTDGSLTPVNGAMGILSVGRIRNRNGNWNLGQNNEFAPTTEWGSLIEPPRFVTQTKIGSPIRYKVENAMVSEDQSGSFNGVQLRTYDAPALAAHYMVLDFTSIAVIDMTGLDAIYAASPNNKITVKFISHDDPAALIGPGGAPAPAFGSVLLTLDIQSTGFTVTNYVDPPVTTGNITNAQFGVDGAVIAALPGVDPTDYIPGNTRYILLTFSSLPVPMMDLIWDMPNPPPAPTVRPDWFIPYEVLDFGGNLYTSADYGMDFAFDVDTYNTALLPGESITAYIGSDRLSFYEGIDFRLAQERGAVHYLNPLTELETRLSIYEVTVGHDAITPQYSSIINTFCNGESAGQPVPFTFLNREGVLGEYAAGVGTLVVHGFEGYDGATGNIPILGNLATFSGAASNDRCAWTDAFFVTTYNSICKGTGVIESKFDSGLIGPPDLRELYDDRISDTVITDPVPQAWPSPPYATPVPEGLAQIESGDILVVKSGYNGEATTKAGTYLVRHAIPQYNPATNPADQWWWSAPTAIAGNGAGWCPVHFPTVVSYDEVAHELAISDPASIKALESTINTEYPIGWESGFPKPAAVPGPGTYTFVYIIRNKGGLATLNPGAGPDYDAAINTYKKSILRLQYTDLTITPSGQCVLTLSPLGTVNDGSYTGGDPAAAPAAVEYPIIATNAELAALLDASYQVSGMKAWPVNVSGENYGLPANNVVGFNDFAGGSVVNGFERFNIDSRLTDTTPVTFTGPANIVDGAGFVAPDQVYPMSYTPEINNDFYEDKTTPVYSYVVNTLMNSLADVTWMGIDLPTTSIGTIVAMPNYYAHCLLPQSQLLLADPTMDPETQYALYHGHRALSGIFLEPSFPRQALNLYTDHPKVVDNNNTLPDPTLLADDEREIGARSSDSYGNFAGVPFAPVTPSAVSFEVRRIRRFHEIQDVNLKLAPLRYAYEIRRGRITDYDSDPTTTSQRGIVTANQFVMDFDTAWVAGTPKAKTPDVWNDGEEYTGTNLGSFLNADFTSNEDVNVHPGDMFRLLDSDGTLLEEVRIERIVSASTLQLAAPGLTTKTPAQLKADGGMRFEIYLRRAPVPLEQSAEELLELITDRVVLKTDATWGDDDGDEVGGFVPELTTQAWEDVANHLSDDLNVTGVGNKKFGTLGVRKGDIVIVDPTGKIPRRPTGNIPYIQERGVRPIGDMGVEGREGYLSGAAVPSSQYDEGYPDTRDDNRGYYRVTKVEDTVLTVTGVSTFSGDVDGDVVFDSTDTLRAYAVYPTVHLSQLNPTLDEGQMDLRPTKHRNAQAKFNYPTNFHSLRPFSYRVIRPSKLFSDDTIDLVLMMRERLLSLIELIGRGFEGKSGDYWAFQKYLHIEDLGSTTNAESGLGLLSNAYLLSVLGRTDVSPFMNNESCVSILDRRFWVMDTQLDSLAPARIADNDPFGMRPVEPGVDYPYTSYNDSIGEQVRPVLPDRIEEAVDQQDRFRPIRYVWLAYRTHTILGSLAAINRFDIEYAQRKAEQISFLLKQESLEKLT